ncbi:MAG: hypothetical protein UHO61_02425 [Acutalibacteraceae bacterium]|nr:hypothetical protein [Acutalibacteraceae bacterium]
MSFFKRKKEENKEENGPVVAAIISNPVSSAVFQDMLKENGIPFICRQEGAGGSVKLLLGGGIVPDYIFVSAKNYNRARELYEVYLLNEPENSDFEEE